MICSKTYTFLFPSAGTEYELREIKVTLNHILNYLSFLRVKFGVRVMFSLVVQKIKESACNAGDQNSIPGLGTSPREGNGYPLQYCCLEGYNPWDHKKLDMTE